jgi:GTPase SAR1 family protein
MTQENPNDLLGGMKKDALYSNEKPKTKKELRGKSPVKEDKRLKLFLYGSAGVGKTVSSLQFPHAYIIDTEKGTDPYDKEINDMNSKVFKTTDIDEAKEEIRTLLTSDHDFTTLIIDPITMLYESCQFKWEKKFNNPNDMRRWTRIKADMKGLQHLLLELDMNVIITAHQKILYGDGMAKIGDTFDSMKGDDYLFDYVFQLIKQKGSPVPLAITEKQRSPVGNPKFPPQFEWSYKAFLKYYGEDTMTKPSLPKVLADDHLITDFVMLLDIVKVESNVLDRWGISETITLDEKNELADLEYEALKKRVDYLKSKLPK